MPHGRPEADTSNLPLMLFIMPALFIVLAGSPVLRLFDSLHSITLTHH